MKIICIGRNYVDHAKELNNPIPKEPVFFLKPDTAYLPNNKVFFIPSFSSDIHHEIELVIKINKIGKHIQPKFAHKYYHEITLGIDFTARDIQQECKTKGLPWEKAKAFDGSAPIGTFVQKSQFQNMQQLSFYLLKNKEKVQVGNTADMLFTIDQIISYVSQYTTLKIGDLIFTGTPAGVGQVQVNDILEGYLEDKKVMQVKVK
jgi:acylpyruvate hydrolase